MSGDGVYGTKLFRKRFDTANALLKVNIWQDKKSIFAIFFRYYDDNNYYAFKFNTRKESTILLVKRVAGVEKILAFWNEELPINQWNRFYIVFDEQVITMNLQLGIYRNVPKIINVVDKDVQRGRIAFATNEESKVYFDGIHAIPYDSN